MLAQRWATVWPTEAQLLLDGSLGRMESTMILRNIEPKWAGGSLELEHRDFNTPNLFNTF